MWANSSEEKKTKSISKKNNSHCRTLWLEHPRAKKECTKTCKSESVVVGLLSFFVCEKCVTNTHTADAKICAVRQPEEASVNWAYRFRSLALVRLGHFFPSTFSMRSFSMWILCTKGFLCAKRSIDETKIIPPCHVNEHIIFDLVSRATCRVCECVQVFFPPNPSFYVCVFGWLFRLPPHPRCCYCCFYIAAEITHGNKVFE